MLQLKDTTTHHRKVTTMTNATNVTTAPTVGIDVSSPREIVAHICRALPDTADYFESGDCWAVENDGVRVFFGFDPEFEDGICWAMWVKEDDTLSPGHPDKDYWSLAGSVGGWGFDDKTTASAEIADVIKDMGGALIKPSAPVAV